ncbi:MAG: hypothetical protein AAFO07_01235 [Bacteroidota bacterium]
MEGLLKHLIHFSSFKKARTTQLIEIADVDKGDMHIDYLDLGANKIPEYWRNIDPKSEEVAYRKRQLSSLLIKTYFFFYLEQSGFSNRDTAEEECWKNWIAVKLLFGQSAKIFPIKACQKLLKQCDKYDFPFLIMDIAKQLRLYYGAQLGDTKKFKKYDDILHNAEEKIKLIKKVKYHYHLLLIYSQHPEENVKKIQETLSAYQQTIADTDQKYKGIAFNKYHWKVQLIDAIHSNEKERVFEVSKMAINYFQTSLKKGKGNIDRLFFCVLAELSCRDKDFSKAQSFLDTTYLNEKKGSWNWFQYQASIVRLLMFQGKYEEAQSYCVDVKQQSKFKLLLESDLTVWKIFDLYFSWMSAKAQLDEPNVNIDFDESQHLDRSSALWLGHSLLLGLYGSNKEAYLNQIKQKPTYLDPLRKAGYINLVKQIENSVFENDTNRAFEEKYVIHMAHHELLLLEEIIPFGNLRDM